jgi:predicted Mrr-cat superfamily restriction endonuclease
MGKNFINKPFAAGAWRFIGKIGKGGSFITYADAAI